MSSGIHIWQVLTSHTVVIPADPTVWWMWMSHPPPTPCQSHLFPSILFYYSYYFVLFCWFNEWNQKLQIFYCLVMGRAIIRYLMTVWHGCQSSRTALWAFRTVSDPSEKWPSLSSEEQPGAADWAVLVCRRWVPTLLTAICLILFYCIISHFSFFPSSSPIYPSLFFKFVLFSLVVIEFTYVYFPKYNLYSLYTVTHVCFLWLTVWHWTANWCAFSWGKLPPPLPSFLSCLQRALCVGMRPYRLFPIHFGMFIFQLTFGKSCYWDFIGIVSESLITICSSTHR